MSKLESWSPGSKSPGSEGLCGKFANAVMAGAVWTAVALLSSFPFTNAYAGFSNGGFESDLTDWNISSYTVPGSGIPTFPPTQESDLGLTPAGANGLTYAVGSGTDSNTGGAVAYPAYGNKAAVVNYGGNNYRSSAIDQTATMTTADIDPSDGKVHIRFSIAPVLQNPNHTAVQQPYFFVEITNLTKGTQLFHTFNFSGQTGVPWVTIGGYQYTDWQTIDVAPGAGVLDVGDQIKVKIIASGCAQGGHEGHVYVDSGPTATTLPGPYISASGPTSASSTAGTLITYTYTYGNTGTAPLTNTVVNAVSPQDNSATPKNLTFKSSTAPGGSCTFPAVDSAGTVSCNFGTLNPNNSGTFTITYALPASATGPVNNGNYTIQGDNASAVLGPLVQTALTSGSLADLSVSITDGVSSTIWGSTLTYTIVVTNSGPSDVTGASLVETLPASLTGATWTCAGDGTSTCPTGSGSGAINESGTINLTSGHYLTYTLTATATGSGSSTINNVVQVSVPGGITDSDTANNTVADVDNVGSSLATLTVDKTGAGTGTVTSVPSGVNVSCGAGTCSGNADFPTGTDVVLYASAPSGSIFSGWSGGGCSGTASSCSVTLSGATTVTADFTVPLQVTPVVGSNGTVSPGTTQPVVPGGTTSFTITPDAGYAVQFSDNCGSGGAQVGGTLVGDTYTTNAIAQDCNVNFSFTNSGVATVTPTVGANGSISPNRAETVLVGESASYTVIPNTGYSTNTPGGTCPAGTWSGNVYTIPNVTTDCSVSFSFSIGYTVTSSVASGVGSGTVTPSSTAVASGGNAVFTITPNSGYVAEIDAASTCAAGTWAADGVTYTVPNVTSSCNVAVDFVSMSSGYPNVFDPPSGHKISTKTGIQYEWKMVWVNSGTAADPLVVVTDTIPAGVTYVPGSLTCTAYGGSTTTSCLEPMAPGNPANQVMWTGSIAADGPSAVSGWATAANRVEIVFRTTTPVSGIVTNTGSAQWDANGNGSVADEIGAGQVAAATNAAIADPPLPVPALSREHVLLLSGVVMLLGILAFGRKEEKIRLG